MKVMRKIIEINEELCDGCGLCVPSCAEGSLKIVDGKVRVVSDNLCDGLGACLGECPQGALHVIEREAEEFDEAAVEEYLSEKAKTDHESEPAVQGGCPSTKLEQFSASTSRREADSAASVQNDETSALTHWPVQIRLVPPNAPFLKGADLLVLADCVPLAFPTLHRDFLEGKAVMMGCPKFDDVESYIEKFSEIFKTAGIKSVTVVVMEVPCCAGLPIIVKRGMELSGKALPMEKVVVSTKGIILKQDKAA